MLHVVLSHINDSNARVIVKIKSQINYSNENQKKWYLIIHPIKMPYMNNMI